MQEVIFHRTKTEYEINTYALMLGMGNACKFHSIQLQVQYFQSSIEIIFDLILSTFDHHGYLLQIIDFWVYITASYK